MPNISRFRPLELLLGWFHPYDEPSKVRDRPMQVLALGLSRCGTESLKLALEDLGYKGVYHSFETKGDECIVWTRLWDAKVAGLKIGVDDFDRLIGDYEAVTDAPTYMFAKELIAAYPDAKVILNYRKDIDAWDRSFRAALLKGLRDAWLLKAACIFSPDFFWRRRITLRCLNDFYGGKFEDHGIEIYRAHYRQLEDMLGKGTYLQWTVEEGWEPLCAFLDKPVPEKPFPRGNAPAAFEKHVAEKLQPHLIHAGVNAAKTFGVVVAVVLAVWLSYVRLF